ncbi:hypothetical protein BT96DRAFT_984885 [Gymnopus androsaceus JB14]|uniref:Uncharacterized protein n=1 Tax=Gymnopus androsaceus JB14 TaxID=1447944 RepID=A0A6A4IEW3_9AGAR|nr:hypothetical protein BT96DRAFT_984885 [Gymnopus androsaceus JB14]
MKREELNQTSGGVSNFFSGLTPPVLKAVRLKRQRPFAFYHDHVHLTMIPRLVLASRSRLSAAAFLHSSSVRRAAQSHTSDSYNKDDTSVSPPPDSKIHRVDPNSDAQKPHESPSGPYSRVGAESAEYKNTDEKYDGDNDTRYGGKKQYMEEKAPETSKRDEGPEGKNSQGRKPE